MGVDIRKMVKETLEQEAWKYADKICGWDKTQIFDYLVEAYINSAEPREKQLEEKDKKIAELENALEHARDSYREALGKAYRESIKWKEKFTNAKNLFDNEVQKKLEARNQLDEVKEIIKHLLYFCNKGSVVGVPEENCSISADKLCEQVKQFLDKNK